MLRNYAPFKADFIPAINPLALSVDVLFIALYASKVAWVVSIRLLSFFVAPAASICVKVPLLAALTNDFR